MLLEIHGSNEYEENTKEVSFLEGIKKIDLLMTKVSQSYSIKFSDC